MNSTKQRARRPWRTIVAPIATAAVACAVLAIGAGLPASASAGSGRPAVAQRLTVAQRATAAAPSAAVPAVPRYYVALNNPHVATARDQVVVGDTLTGKRLAAVSPPKGSTFGGVTGAADDRSFVLDVRQFPWSSTWFAVTPRTWYLLKIAPGTAHPTRLTKLRIPATPNGAQVDGMALSPNGREFAVMYQPNAWGPAPGPVTLRIYSMATGKTVHTWVGPAPSPSGPGDYLFGQYLYLDDNATLSWASDGRSLAFVYGAGLITDTTVRTLTLASAGHGLLADSRLVLGFKPGSAPDCTSLMVTANGRSVVCGAALAAGSGSTGGCSSATGLARPGIAEYSAATGRLTGVLYRYTGTCIAGQADVLWASPSGGTVLGYLGITRQSSGRSPVGKYQVGVFAHDAFRPLPIRLAGGTPSPATIAF
jgi:hypothetical protein